MKPSQFVKTLNESEHARLAAEADGLAAIRATGAVRVPQVFACKKDNHKAQLILEHLELRSLNRNSAALLGHALAKLHRTQHTQYGWAEDNFIGPTPQKNAWTDSWPVFYARQRLLPQLKWALGNGMPKDVYEQGLRLSEQCAAFFVNEQHPQPSLLHGDLWCGNAASLAGDIPVIFDPAVYFGDRVTDIAMSELFGGFPDSFYAAYRADWPLPTEYEIHKVLYNLYHVLNHFNLYGAGYLGQTRRMIERLLAELRG